MQPCLPAQPHWLVAVTSIQATSWLAVVVRHILCGRVFSSPTPGYVALSDSKLPPDPPVRGFPTVWKHLLHNSLPRMGLCPQLFYLFVFYILSYLLSKRVGCLSGCLVSSANVQKLFCGSCSAFKWSLMNLWGRKWSPHPIPPPSWDHPPIYWFFETQSLNYLYSLFFSPTCHLFYFYA